MSSSQQQPVLLPNVSEQARMDINKGETVLSTVRRSKSEDFFKRLLADRQTGVGHCRWYILTHDVRSASPCTKDVTEMQIYRPRTAQTKAVYEMLLNRAPLSVESC